jgi:hypothetical protein
VASAPSLSGYFVPNYRQTISSSQCTARGGTNAQHLQLPFPPYFFSSCSPPAYASGTAARLGQNSTAAFGLSVLHDNPATTETDEADYAVTASLSDVRCLTSGGSSGCSTPGDFYNPHPSGGDIRLRFKARISDDDNFNASSATVQDFDISVPIDCDGSGNCSINTTLESLTGGEVVYGSSRQLMQVFRMRVADSGLDGTLNNSDDKDFAQSGLYVGY